MPIPSSFRRVRLLDGRATDSSLRPIVEAELYRDYPPNQLDSVEALWARARADAATAAQAAGLAPLEHSHWDWRNKADSVEAGLHMLVAVECESMTQGLMAVLRSPRGAWADSGRVVYVDYLEVAPWNLKGAGSAPRLLGVGTALLADAVRLAAELGLDGRVGLHSLPQAEAFYGRCGMTRVGPDPQYYDLTYFEFVGRQGPDWLAKIGEP
jgi:hypothetical protein